MFKKKFPKMSSMVFSGRSTVAFIVPTADTATAKALFQNPCCCYCLGTILLKRHFRTITAPAAGIIVFKASFQ
jgi:hypothetical protein